MIRLVLACALLPLSASAQTPRTLTSPGAELRVAIGGDLWSAASRRAGAWRAAPAAALRPAGGVPVVVTVSGLDFGYLLGACDGVTVFAALAEEGTQTADLVPGDCQVSVVNYADDGAREIVARDVEGTGPVALALDGPLQAATIVLRDVDGTVLQPSDLDPSMTTNLLTAYPGADGRGVSFFELGTLGPQPSTVPTYRYSVPEDAGYRVDWSLRTWSSAPERYHFKVHYDAFDADVELGNGPGELLETTLDLSPLATVGDLRGNVTTDLFDRLDGGVLLETYNWYLCDAPRLAPPYTQTLYDMADPAPGFMVRDGLEIVAGARDELWAPAQPGNQPAPCSELAPGDRHLAALPYVRRETDGVARAYALPPEVRPGLAPGGAELDGVAVAGLAPLRFTPGIRRLTSRLWLSVSELPFYDLGSWPLGESVRAPLVYAQLGDAQSAPVPYEIRDAAGAVIASGDDLTAHLSSALPVQVPATLQARYAHPSARVGGVQAAVEVELAYRDAGPPALVRLTVEDADGPTDTVAEGDGALRLALEAPASASASVRPFGQEGAPWTELALVSEGAGAYRASLDLAVGVYDLRIVADDAAGNQLRHTSTPAFEVSGGVSAEDNPVEKWLGNPVPNPARTGATIRASLDAPGALRAELYDVLGRRVGVAEEACAAGPCALRLDVLTLRPGVYHVRVSTGTRGATRRLTVTR